MALFAHTLACLSRDNSSHILQQNEEVHRICRGRDEVETLIEPPRFFVFCVHGKCSNSGNVGCLQCTLHCISQERFTNTLSLPTAIRCKTGEQPDGYRMFRQTLL